jgi:hypothetical protein
VFYWFGIFAGRCWSLVAVAWAYAVSSDGEEFAIGVCGTWGFEISLVSPLATLVGSFCLCFGLSLPTYFFI